MESGLFRKKSLDKFQSPESLHDYIRVANPGMWILMAAMILLLVGACIWGIWGTVESTVNAVIHVDDGVVTCYADEADAERIHPGMRVRVGQLEGTLGEQADTSEMGYRYTVEMDPCPDEGIWSAEIVLDAVNPISFVVN